MTGRVPPPVASPTPAIAVDDDDPITGSHAIPATLGDLKKAKRELTTENLNQAQVITKMIFSADVKWFVGIIATVVVATATTIAWGQTAIKEKVDSGIHPVQLDLDTHKRVEAAAMADLKADVKEAKADAKEAARSSSRAEVMVEMLLNNRGITPPPKEPLDGGR